MNLLFTNAAAKISAMNLLFTGAAASILVFWILMAVMRALVPCGHRACTDVRLHLTGTT